MTGGPQLKNYLETKKKDEIHIGVYPTFSKYDIPLSHTEIFSRFSFSVFSTPGFAWGITLGTRNPQAERLRNLVVHLYRTSRPVLQSDCALLNSRLSCHAPFALYGAFNAPGCRLSGKPHRTWPQRQLALLETSGKLMEVERRSNQISTRLSPPG